MKVIVELPGATLTDAAVFGLWLKGVLEAAHENGELDTVHGDIHIKDES